MTVWVLTIAQICSHVIYDAKRSQLSIEKLHPRVIELSSLFFLPQGHHIIVILNKLINENLNLSTMIMYDSSREHTIYGESPSFNILEQILKAKWT